MDILWVAGAAGAATMGTAWFATTALRKAPRREKGAILLPADTVPRGEVRIHGDVIVRGAQARRMGSQAELDVPTQAVDDIIAALQGAGFDVRDTGLTVDTDEGEETLTTVAMDLANLPSGRLAQQPGDRLTIEGDLVVERGARIAFNADVEGDITLQEAVTTTGVLQARGHVHIGPRCRVVGDVLADRDIHIAAGAKARRVVAGAHLHLAEPAPDPMARYEARRIHVAPQDA